MENIEENVRAVIFRLLLQTQDHPGHPVRPPAVTKRSRVTNRFVSQLYVKPNMFFKLLHVLGYRLLLKSPKLAVR